MFGVRPGATFAESSMPAGVGAARGDGKVPRRTAAMKAHLVFLARRTPAQPRRDSTILLRPQPMKLIFFSWSQDIDTEELAALEKALNDAAVARRPLTRDNLPLYD
jgi:hypothetical protein